jgi:HEPN domain-containing protein
MPSRKRLEEAWEWLGFAREDLETAEVLLAADPPRLRQALFHSQQGAEKSLKACLVVHEVTYPLTHSLTLLMDLCTDLDAALHDSILPCVWLTQFAVRFRYPGDFAEPSSEQATEGLATAKAVYASIAERLTTCSP